MHRSIGAAVMTLLLVTSGVAFGFAGTVGAQGEAADATISQQTSGGTTVVVEEVTVPEGGFVTIHDSTVLDGGEAVLTSVRGSSNYLEPGTYENVTVTLDEPLEEDDTLVAMPHRDTDGDRIYSFVSSGAEADGPYTADGEAVVDDASLTVESDDGMGENEMNENDDTATEDTSDGDGPGFGIVAALLAIIGSVFAVRRLN